MDGRGLYLLLAPTGGRWWRFRYSVAGKEKLLSLGTYPDVSLRAARDARDEARKLLSGLLPRNGTTLKVRVSAILSFEGARNGTEGLHA